MACGLHKDFSLKYLPNLGALDSLRELLVKSDIYATQALLVSDFLTSLISKVVDAHLIMKVSRAR